MIETAGPLASLVIAGIALVFIGIRSDAVSQYRRRLVEDVYSACINSKGGSNKWRWEVLRSVDMPEMTLKFWRRLDSFYPDRAFVQASQGAERRVCECPHLPSGIHHDDCPWKVV